ncbi:MAG: hypothetical protein AYL33_004890 [Candidatus Bathyarchaeota archaeon B63]|nr:MAG: hypothetical protein AYL33_004890 [Candidatus Bathyarchaeota archaeon B63]
MSIVKLVNVTKRFGGITALRGISLSIEDGEYVCILGPTGAGKTTLLRIIAGLVEPDEGEIYIEGRRVNGVPPERRNAVYMFQNFALFPHMTVWENVSFGPMVKEWSSEKIENVTSETLEMVRLGERRDAYPSELSGGMQQRVALARGIAAGARILLLDEPFGALDARLRVNLRTQLRSLVKDQGLTAIHVTHDQEEALMVADRIVILREGRIEQTGLPQDIYNHPKSIFVMSFVGGANFLDGVVSRVTGSGSTIEIRGGLRIRVSDTSNGAGERVVVGVRREDVSLGKSRKRGFNNLVGEVLDVMFVGGSIEYVVRLENDMTMLSRILLGEGSMAFKEGDMVIVSFHPSECHVFQYPERGLLKEIEAI